MTHLQKIAEYANDVDHWVQVFNAKAEIAASLNNRQLNKKSVYSEKNVGSLIDDYTTELDSLLNIYDELDKLSGRADFIEDDQLAETARQEKAKVVKVLSKWADVGPYSESDLSKYKEEAQKVLELTREINKAQQSTLGSEDQRLRSTQKQLIESLDQSVFDLLVEAGYNREATPTVSEFIKEWKAERLTDIKTRFTEYEIIWNELFYSGTSQERSRMFSAELKNALLNYSNGYYLAAEYQLLEILKRYQKYYDDLTPVKFYIAEACIHRMAFDRSKGFLEQVISSTKPTSYKAEALVRMMQYENELGTTQNFFTYYQQILEQDSLSTANVIDYANYLAANKFFENFMFEKAMDALKRIHADSEFYLPSQLLVAIIYTNFNDYTKAEPIFKQLAKKDTYPWSDIHTASIRNTALLKLGLIYYQRSEYTKAIYTLEEVSPGFSQLGEALIAQAWAYIQLGNFERAKQKAHDILRNFITSEYTYEALVLSAHCNRQLNQTDEALNDYRYVIRARGALERQKRYDDERIKSRVRIKSLNKMEDEALERKQETLYVEVDRIRTELNEFLVRVQEKSDTGTQLVQDYYDERIDVMQRLFELDDVVEWAVREGRTDLAIKAAKQRQRLMLILQTFRSDQKIDNTSYIVDFPLAAKEAGSEYKESRYNIIFSDINLEKRRLQQALEKVNSYKHNSNSDRLESKMEVEILEFDLNNLQDRVSKLHKLVSENEPSAVKTNLEHWSNLSGFGMMDIVYNQRKEKLHEIDTYATQLATVENLLMKRRTVIEKKLELFEQQIRQMQDKLLSRKIQLEQLERETYFENYYFETKEHEEESWEERLRQLSSPKSE